MKKLVSILTLIVAFFNASGQELLTIADTTQTWYLPVGTKIDIAVNYKSVYTDSSQMVIYPVTQYKFDCGSWIGDTLSTDWKFVDTTSTVNETVSWVEDRPTLAKIIPIVNGVRSCPCGCPPIEEWYQKRIDAISGKVQVKIKRIKFNYSQEKDTFTKLLLLHSKKN